MTLNVNSYNTPIVLENTRGRPLFVCCNKLSNKFLNLMPTEIYKLALAPIFTVNYRNKLTKLFLLPILEYSLWNFHIDSFPQFAIIIHCDFVFT